MDYHNRERVGSYTVAKKLSPRHYKIMDYYIQGLKATDIAAKITNEPDSSPITARTVRNLIHSPNFQHEASLRRAKIEDKLETSTLESNDKVAEELQRSTIAAAKKLTALLDSDSEQIQYRAAQDILDRGGYPKLTKTENKTENTPTIPEEVSTLLLSVLNEVNPDKPSKVLEDLPDATSSQTPRAPENPK